MDMTYILVLLRVDWWSWGINTSANLASRSTLMHRHQAMLIIYPSFRTIIRSGNVNQWSPSCMFDMWKGLMSNCSVDEWSTLLANWVESYMKIPGHISEETNVSWFWNNITWYERDRVWMQKSSTFNCLSLDSECSSWVCPLLMAIIYMPNQ